KISEQIREALARAAEARDCAYRETNPDRKSDFLDMELRWSRLAESYKFVERANQFLDDVQRQRYPERPVPKSDNTHATLIVCEKCGGKAPLIDCAPCTLSRDIREIWTFKCEVCGENLRRIVER